VTWCSSSVLLTNDATSVMNLSKVSAVIVPSFSARSVSAVRR